MKDDYISNNIAIIGMAGRFPGAANTEQLWENLKNGRESITHFTKKQLSGRDFESEYVLQQDNYIRARSVLDDVELFDADFFNFTPSEATYTDPQQRIWLELAWTALESAGYAGSNYEGAIGVYTGYLNSNYLMHNLLKNRTAVENYVRTRYSDDFATLLANTNSYLATRTAYKLNLKGPAINLLTACSTSLVTVIMAVQSLLQMESDICIAGGINIAVPQNTGYFYQEGAILSKDGHCRPFDSDAQGTVFGSGGGAVVLKRLEEALDDGDNILAVIRGAAINNDGANKVGFTAPSIDGQAECISLAQSLAEVSPDSISYIEAHGTGTPMGDPIEIAGLTKAFGDCDGKLQFCGIGSIKSNIGHLDSAAGIAGLIKTILALQHKQIPPTLHYKKPNPIIDFEKSPFYVVDKLKNWEETVEPRRAGVSAFGVGGTNAHIVLEEAPHAEPSERSGRHQLLIFSAKTENALTKLGQQLGNAFKKNSSLNVADAAWTLQKRRQHFQMRLFAICDDNAASAAEAITKRVSQASTAMQIVPEIPPAVAFAFPGQGSHYYGMASELLDQELVFQNELKKCCQLANQFIDVDLYRLFAKEITKDEYVKQMSHNGIAQLAIFSVDYAMAQLWQHWGIKPKVVFGHSLGEWVAACTAGVLTLEHAITAVWHRGRLMHSVSGDGAALTVFASKEDVLPHLNENTYFAAENAPTLTLISGPKEAVLALMTRLKEENINSRLLDITVAVHSPLLDTIIQPFEEILRGLKFSKPSVPIFSTATGTHLTEKQALDPHYWAFQMRSPVQFSSTVQELSGHYPSPLILETGPGKALTTLCQLQRKNANQYSAVASLDPKTFDNEHKQILHAVGQLWCSGISIDFSQLSAEKTRKCVSLPTYCFDRKRFWIDPPSMTASEQSDIKSSNIAGEKSAALRQTAAVQQTNANSIPVETRLTQIWKDILGVNSIGPNDDFNDLGGDSLTAVRLMERIRRETNIGLPLGALTAAPTIAQMAKLIQKSGPSSTQSACLVPVKKGTSERPSLFVPHGAGGNVHWGYVNIAAGFHEGQTVWGFEPPDEMLFQTFEEMATFYINEMKTIQPGGPYYLAGYCYGGILAYEMACQLRKQNEEVGFLGLMEASPSNSGYGKISISPQYIKRFAANLPLVAKEFWERPAVERNKRIVNRLNRMKRIGFAKVTNLFNPSEEMKEAEKIVLDDMVGAVNDFSEETAHIWANNLKILQEHTSAQSDLNLEIFQTEQQSLFSPLDPTMGWEPLTSGSIACHIVPGSHGTVVNPPLSEHLGKRVCEQLWLAQERYGDVPTE